MHFMRIFSSAKNVLVAACIIPGENILTPVKVDSRSNSLLDAAAWVCNVVTDDLISKYSPTNMSAVVVWQ